MRSGIAQPEPSHLGQKLKIVAISDLHLGSKICRAKRILRTLSAVHDGNLRTKLLVLNGDVRDDANDARMKRSHWECYCLLRKISKHTRVVWIEGNHDPFGVFRAHEIGAEWREELVEGGVYFEHGHRYDDFVENNPIRTKVGDVCYHGLHALHPRLAKLAKNLCKSYLRVAVKVRQGVTREAFKLGCQWASAGHTHEAGVWEANGEGVTYVNSGSYAQEDATYVAFDGDDLRVVAAP